MQATWNFLLLIASLTLVSAVSHAQANPNLQILDVAVGGAGCPQGSVHPALAPDGSALTVLYDRFVGELGAGDPLVRIVCDIRLRLRKPQDMTFAFSSADFRGFINLEEGARAVQRVRLGGGFDETGQREVTFAEQEWAGPISENFYFSALAPSEATDTISCKSSRAQTMIRLRVAITLRSKKQLAASGQIAVDSFDGGMTQKFNLRWTKCPLSNQRHD